MQRISSAGPIRIRRVQPAHYRPAAPRNGWGGWTPNKKVAGPREHCWTGSPGGSGGSDSESDKPAATHLQHHNELSTVCRRPQRSYFPEEWSQARGSSLAKDRTRAAGLAEDQRRISWPYPKAGCDSDHVAGFSWRANNAGFSGERWEPADCMRVRSRWYWGRF